MERTFKKIHAQSRQIISCSIVKKLFDSYFTYFEYCYTISINLLMKQKNLWSFIILTYFLIKGHCFMFIQSSENFEFLYLLMKIWINYPYFRGKKVRGLIGKTFIYVSLYSAHMVFLKCVSFLLVSSLFSRKCTAKTKKRIFSKK